MTTREMTQAEARTRTNAIPVFVGPGHYQMQSRAGKRAGNVYNIRYDYILKCWNCDCYDAKDNGNDNCKHVRRFNEYAAMMREEKSAAVESAERQLKAERKQTYNSSDELEKANNFITELLLKQSLLERELENTRQELSSVSMVASSLMREYEQMRADCAQQIAAIHADMQSQIDALKAKRTRASQPAPAPAPQVIVPNINITINTSRASAKREQAEKEIITMEIPEDVDMSDPGMQELKAALESMAA